MIKGELTGFVIPLVSLVLMDQGREFSQNSFKDALWGCYGTAKALAWAVPHRDLSEVPHGAVSPLQHSQPLAGLHAALAWRQEFSSF